MVTAEILEITKVLLSVYFAFARLNGLSEEETKQLYDTEKEKFERNTPDKLDKID